MDIQITPVPSATGDLRGNRQPEICYFVQDMDGDSLLVDPGEDAGAILQVVRDSRSKLAAVLVTHGHYDHIASVTDIQRAVGAEFWLHSADEPLLRHAMLFSLAFGGTRRIEVPSVDRYLGGWETIRFGGLLVRVFETPGHTPGSVVFLCGEHLFSGDTLLADTAGGTHLPGGDTASLRCSLEKLALLPPETILEPGHGPTSTLGDALLSPKVRAIREGRFDPGWEGLIGEVESGGE